MTESEAIVAPAAPPRRWPWILFCLLLLAMLAIGGFRGWKLWRAYVDTEDVIAGQNRLIQQFGHQISDAQAQIEQIRERNADLSDGQHRDADAISAMQGRVEDLQHSLQSLSSSVQGGRQRAQMIGVEELLLIANDRAQLAQDAPGAATALQLAQNRLATLTEPRLFEVRKAIAEERTALLAVPIADHTSVSLSLASLIRLLPNLPRREQGRAPHPDLSASTSKPATGVWNSIGQVLSALFIVRRTDKPIEPLLAPEQEALVGDLVELQLESARLALLQRDTESFRGSIASAQKLLDEDYQAEDAGVISMHKELEVLGKLELSPPLPDISRSLGLLRAYLDAIPPQ